MILSIAIRLDPLPSVCAPEAGAIAVGRGGAPGARRSTWGWCGCVLADLRDLLVRQAAGQEAGPVGDAAQQGRGLDQAIVVAGRMGTGARPASGFRTRRAHRVPFDIAGGRQQAGVILKGL